MLAIDFDKWAAATYRANFPGTHVECGAVADFVATMPAANIVIGGPPCQPFSDAGENEGESDDRDGMPDFIAAVAKVRPRMFLMENVRGLLKEKHLPYFGRVLAQLESLGYQVEYRVMDAVSFGVPQFRSRVWVWGIRHDVSARHCWPMRTHDWPPPEECMFGTALLPGVTVGQALGISGEIRQPRAPSQIRRDHPTDEPSPTVMGPHGGNRTLMLIQSCADPAQTIDRPSPTLRSGGAGHDGCCLRIIGGGSNPRHPGDERTERDITDEPSTTISVAVGNAMPAIKYHWSDAMLQKHPPASPASPAPTVQAKWAKGGAEGLIEVLNAPAMTIVGGNREPWPNEEYRSKFVRRLTPLECLRLQSGPDDFKWPAGIGKTAMYRVVGNGWASRMGAIFADAFRKVDPKSETVIDLFCGGGLGASGWHGRYWSYE